MRGTDVLCVVLAAGKGSRLLPLTSVRSKPLLTIVNKPILQIVLEHAAEGGLNEYLIVVDAKSEEQIDGLMSALPGVNSYRLVVQEHKLGIAHAVASISRWIDRPFILLLGDSLIFPNPVPKLLEMADVADGVLIGQTNQNSASLARNFAIQCSSEGWATKVIEKPKMCANHIKGCGFYLFKPSFLDYVGQTPRTALRNEYEITHSIQMYIADGAHLAVWSGVEWELNLTKPGDLLAANLEMLRRLDIPFMLADGAVVPENAVIERSVIGPEAKITGCTRIVDSLLLGNVRYNSTKDIVKKIIVDDVVVDLAQTSA